MTKGTNKREESISTITLTVFVTHIFVGAVQTSILFDANTVTTLNTFMKHDTLNVRTNIISLWCKYNKPRRINQNKRLGLVLLTWEISVASHSKIRSWALILHTHFNHRTCIKHMNYLALYEYWWLNGKLYWQKAHKTLKEIFPR